jgi:hypothetical protein
VTAAPAAVLTAVPLLPTPEEAQEWARRELSDPVYARAEPTFLDRAARAVFDAIVRLLNPDLSGGWGPAAAVVTTVVVVALLVAALLIWGVPRARARADGSVAVFGAVEHRTAAQLRADAAEAASRSDWDAAVVLRFRALAVALGERVLVTTTPGTTAQAFARQAARVFPAHADALRDAASGFDDVRYLRRPGTGALYDDVAGLDDALAGAGAVALA